MARPSGDIKSMLLGSRPGGGGGGSRKRGADSSSNKDDTILEELLSQISEVSFNALIHHLSSFLASSSSSHRILHSNLQREQSRKGSNLVLVIFILSLHWSSSGFTPRSTVSLTPVRKKTNITVKKKLTSPSQPAPLTESNHDNIYDTPTNFWDDIQVCNNHFIYGVV